MHLRKVTLSGANAITATEGFHMRHSSCQAGMHAKERMPVLLNIEGRPSYPYPLQAYSVGLFLHGVLFSIVILKQILLSR